MVTASTTITSSGNEFELGFFSPGNENSGRSSYLGIWYKRVSKRTVVWVAKRDNPLTDSSAVLTIVADGNLVIREGSFSHMLSNLSSSGNTSATLLDSGNLVLIDRRSGDLLWQSFDYPTDTLLPGMKVGYDKRNGKTWSLLAWKSREDPGPGVFSFELDPQGTSQFFILKEFQKYWTSGTWNGQIFNQIPEMGVHYIGLAYTSNENGSYFTYSMYGHPIISRLVLDVSGQLQVLSWDETIGEWTKFWARPRELCDVYSYCEGFGTCNSSDMPFHQCLHGFKPNSVGDRDAGDMSGGCVGKVVLLCGNGTDVNGRKDQFLRISEVRLPANSIVLSHVRSLGDCDAACSSNCLCSAYSYDDSHGCSIWGNELLNVVQLIYDDPEGKDFYLRLAASRFKNQEVEMDYSRPRSSHDAAGYRWLLLLLVEEKVAKQSGYMSPEYASEGLFSIKSDVFSFGVLLLEILSGKRSTSFYNSDSLNVLGYAWDLWKSGRGEGIKDPILPEIPSANMLLRYVNIALLCVQESAADRPTMLNVVSMLSNEQVLLPSPKQPAFSATRNTILQGEKVTSSTTITSAGNEFELGFFSPRNKSSRRSSYVGIWYKRVSKRTVVWVANRDYPLADSSAVLTIAADGNLVIREGSFSHMLSNIPSSGNTSATLLDSGNLVLIDRRSGDLLWQSFDYPSDTLLPGMKVGYDKRNGKTWSLLAWKSREDPGPGVFSFELDPQGTSQFFILKEFQKSGQRKGFQKYWTSGTWNGQIFTQIPEMAVNYISNATYISNENESYFTYSLKIPSATIRLMLDISGQLQVLSWDKTKGEWNKIWAQPRELGDIKGQKDQFLRLSNVSLPANSIVLSQARSVGDCESACFSNCSCSAYTYDSNGSHGCSIWGIELLNVQLIHDDPEGRDFYLRLAASEFLSECKVHLTPYADSRIKRWKWIILALAVPMALLATVSFFFCLWRRKSQNKGSMAQILFYLTGEDSGEDLMLFDISTSTGAADCKCSSRTGKKKEVDLPLFSFASVSAATDNFSDENKLGEGGFGPVYKVRFNLTDHFKT
ncbi:hypothetical protein RHSIM_RhsimUnG0256500 [Rhododendron simsii]|uniref:Uncharacterized protein n=1 Tax=Rhododendron simsii TaxID=118357 RepID=A0A834L3J9_RHOSS|nr:hypothetical protein RHSIM_RhsimUnG0256500 [Rhododendron simsii]